MEAHPSVAMGGESIVVKNVEARPFAATGGKRRCVKNAEVVNSVVTRG